MGEARRTVLAVDVGGRHVKLRTSAVEERRDFESSPELTPQKVVDRVLELADGLAWDVVSIGVPTPVRGGKVIAEPVNLGDGWVGFDFEAAFGKPTRVVNDAVMQAIGSYAGGRMLFLGLGTGLGSALITEANVEPMELGHLPFRRKTFEDYVSRAALERRGRKKWRRDVTEVVERLTAAIEPDEVVLGGGAVDELDELPDGVRRGDNDLAFVGGFRLWDDEWAARASRAARRD